MNQIYVQTVNLLLEVVPSVLKCSVDAKILKLLDLVSNALTIDGA